MVHNIRINIKNTKRVQYKHVNIKKFQEKSINLSLKSHGTYLNKLLDKNMNKKSFCM